MNVSCVRLCTLGLLPLALLGCASTPPIKDAAVVSSPLAKDAAKAKAPGANSAPGDADNALRQARAAREAGDLEGAAKTLSQLVLIAPDNPVVLGEYAKTLIARGRSDDALAFLERAIGLQPSDWSLYSALGVAYDQKGDYPAAQASYGRALTLKPGEPTVLSNSALSHMQSGDLDGAEKLLMQAAQNGAEFPRIAGNLALMRSLKNSSPQPAAAKTPASAPVAAAPAPVPPNAAVEAAPLPAPISPMRADGAGSNTLQTLKTDPGVRMQAVPGDAEAGRIAPKTLVMKKAAPPAEPAQAAEAPILRRALSIPTPAKQANTQQ